MENVAYKYICSDGRCVIFKYINEILPNKLRVFNIKRKPYPNWDTYNIEENNLLMVYYCEEKMYLIQFVRELLQQVLLRNYLILIMRYSEKYICDYIRITESSI